MLPKLQYKAFFLLKREGLIICPFNSIFFLAFHDKLFMAENKNFLEV